MTLPLFRQVLLDSVQRPGDIGAGRLAVPRIVIGRAQVTEHGIKVNIGSCHHAPLPQTS